MGRPSFRMCFSPTFPCAKYSSHVFQAHSMPKQLAILCMVSLLC